MSEPNTNIEAAKECLTDSISLISEGKNEQVVRDSFTSYLRHIFPDQPKWVVRHIQGSESAVKINKGAKSSTGFVDNLVDLTAIEYEGNLTVASKYNTGLNQVKDYCSSLVNKGHDPEFWAQTIADRVVSVGGNCHPMIAEQAEAFKDAVRATALYYIKEAIKSDRTTLIGELEKQGQSEMANIIRRL